MACRYDAVCPPNHSRNNVVLSRSLAEVETTSTVQKDDRIVEMKRNAEGKDNRIIELESRYKRQNTLIRTRNVYLFRVPGNGIDFLMGCAHLQNSYLLVAQTETTPPPLNRHPPPS